MWRKPVGEGAKRVTIVSVMSSYQRPANGLQAHVPQLLTRCQSYSVLQQPPFIICRALGARSWICHIHLAFRSNTHDDGTRGNGK